MDEYIKRQAALDALQAPEIFNINPRHIELIKSIPAADVAPVVHGRFAHDGPRFVGGVDWWHCSNCGGLVSGAETRFDYCPHCGARMDGDAE